MVHCSRAIRSFNATVAVWVQYLLLRLNDGGHIEHFEHFATFEKAIEEDGGHRSEDGHWAKDLLKALLLAREKLHCSFIGLDGRDVIEDVKKNLLTRHDVTNQDATGL